MLNDAAGVKGNHAALPYSRTPDYRCRQFPERITPFVRRSPAAFIVTSFVRVADVRSEFIIAMAFLICLIMRHSIPHQRFGRSLKLTALQAFEFPAFERDVRLPTIRLMISRSLEMRRHQALQ
jgi:hypothetical protein